MRAINAPDRNTSKAIAFLIVHCTFSGHQLRNDGFTITKSEELLSSIFKKVVVEPESKQTETIPTPVSRV